MTSKQHIEMYSNLEYSISIRRGIVHKGYMIDFQIYQRPFLSGWNQVVEAKNVLSSPFSSLPETESIAPSRSRKDVCESAKLFDPLLSSLALPTKQYRVYLYC